MANTSEQTLATLLLKMALDHNSAITALATASIVAGEVNYKKLVQEIRRQEKHYSNAIEDLLKATGNV